MERTLFCAQPYVRSPEGIAPGHLRRFFSEDAAMRAARAMRPVSQGVVVYSVTGSWDAGYWREPELIAAYGDVPQEARAGRTRLRLAA